jgi:hypothetical protein
MTVAPYAWLVVTNADGFTGKTDEQVKGIGRRAFATFPAEWIDFSTERVDEHPNGIRTYRVVGNEQSQFKWMKKEGPWFPYHNDPIPERDPLDPLPNDPPQLVKMLRNTKKRADK